MVEVLGCGWWVVRTHTCLNFTHFIPYDAIFSKNLVLFSHVHNILMNYRNEIHTNIITVSVYNFLGRSRGVWLVAVESCDMPGLTTIKSGDDFLDAMTENSYFPDIQGVVPSDVQLECTNKMNRIWGDAKGGYNFPSTPWIVSEGMPCLILRWPILYSPWASLGVLTTLYVALTVGR